MLSTLYYFVVKGKLITARKQSLGQGNIFTPVCHSVHGVVYLPGGCTCWQGCTCQWGVPAGGYLPGGVPAGGCTCRWGVPARGCTCWGVYLPGECTCQGVPARGCTCQGVPVGGLYLPGGCTCQEEGVPGRYTPPPPPHTHPFTQWWSISRWYASYWNAFLFEQKVCCLQWELNLLHLSILIPMPIHLC